jgi:YjbE family integral membrane protein
MDWLTENALALFNVLMIDLTLAGDNAIVVGLAASRVHPSIRQKVIFWGIAGAVVLRILFSGIAQQLLQVIGLTLAGGLLLLFVAWRMYREITGGGHSAHNAETSGASGDVREMAFWPALWTILIADVSMSLDNVLAVAGAAGESTLVLVIGLALSIVLMAVASNYIAKLLATYPWISWVGLLIIVWVALDMIYSDSHRVTCELYNIGCSETLFQGILHRLGIGG